MWYNIITINKKGELIMKKETRVKLVCRKEMSNGQIDMFEVMVLAKDKVDKKKFYEDAGYTVTVK